MAAFTPCPNIAGIIIEFCVLINPKFLKITIFATIVTCDGKIKVANIKINNKFFNGNLNLANPYPMTADDNVTEIDTFKTYDVVPKIDPGSSKTCNALP